MTKPCNEANRPIIKFVCLICLVLILVAVAPTVTAEPKSAPYENFVSNSDFEQEGQSWALCGGSRIVTAGVDGIEARNIYQGERGMRLGNPNVGECSSEFFAPSQIAYQQIDLPADLTELTISFWYTRRGNYFDDDTGLGFSFNDPGMIKIGLSTDPLYAVANLEGIILDEITPFDQPGWHFYRQVLSTAEIDQLRQQIGDGQSTYLYFRFTGLFTDPAFQSGDQIAYYIDQVHVENEAIKTAESPFPAELAAIDDRPIILTSFDPNHPSPVNDNQFAIFRMNPNGTAAQHIYPGVLAQPELPTWSNDGNKISVIDSTVSNPLEPHKSGLQDIFSTMNADGSNITELYRTLAGGGDTSPPNPDEEIPNVNSRITGIEWSPDDSEIATTVCFRVSYSFYASDETCEVQFRNSATGEKIRTLENGFRVDWSADDRLLFGTASSGIPERGIFEIDLDQGGFDSPSLLIRNWQGQIPFHGDYSPSWAPDGNHFALVRDVPGKFYSPNGGLYGQKAIIMFDRAQLPQEADSPMFLLLVDHGDILGDLVWSPDGKFILYTLYQYGDITTADVWWLEVGTGLTGRVTTNGASVAPSWRPNEGTVVIPPTGLDEKVFLPFALR